jgi:hypothetical protein
MSAESAAPIPPELWERLRAFIAAKAHGKVVLQIERGQVQALHCTTTYYLRKDRGVFTHQRRDG